MRSRPQRLRSRHGSGTCLKHHQLSKGLLGWMSGFGTSSGRDRYREFLHNANKGHRQETGLHSDGDESEKSSKSDRERKLDAEMKRLRQENHTLKDAFRDAFVTSQQKETVEERERIIARYEARLQTRERQMDSQLNEYKSIIAFEREEKAALQKKLEEERLSPRPPPPQLLSYQTEGLFSATGTDNSSVFSDRSSARERTDGGDEQQEQPIGWWGRFKASAVLLAA
ncbi:unnamed protein product [Vitrella brassicaformis CCMP3155]|uniref:Uncharacterized protein n=1 Tax=Vitrella brassicaformis (strain CCMP3155) TaxID=1169540 RepID=A0A0G4FD80_VITBC|nr:unnamed protein product [Vitrella brassicaformis CCMP3155]|eukprot:CEM11188.1 unnamed protein product [Vitrella brassicaformis CCMP3155]